jgi:uncharacterized protein
VDKEFGKFIWNIEREKDNITKHGVDFLTAIKAFRDVDRKVFKDSKHSSQEERFFCIGKVSHRIITIRFTCRGEQIRIIGAGYWRRGKIYYEEG